MKRLLVILLLVAMPLAAGEEKWWESYNRGVKAVNSKNYDVAVAALQKALAQQPTESTAIRAGRNDIITYVPHFWLGIARLNLGEVDGALLEWKTSEEQGAIAKTDYYPKLRDWVARAQAEKERSARTAAGDSKKAADAALARALSAQVEALTAGGDRTETYRAANRKLQEALGVFNSAGSNIASYKRAEATASEARDLFAQSAEDAKRVKSARAATPPRVSPAPAVVQQQAVPQPAATSKPEVTQTVVTVPVAPAQQSPVTGTVAARDANPAPSPAVPSVAATTAPAAKAGSSIPPPVAPIAKVSAPTSRVAARSQLESAYRAFASGKVDQSEQILTSVIGAAPSGEAFLLRGCTRYTRAMLSRNPATLLDSARDDFRAALKMNPALKLDSRTFSPKLVAFFESARNSG